MPASKQLLVIIYATAYANAFVDFNVEPTCVPNKDDSDEHLELILPFLCKFDEDADYTPPVDCTDIPEACKDSTRKKALWASTKIYASRQGTDRPACRDFAHLSRDVEHPECVFGKPVPELRIGDLMTSAWNAREFAERILSRNPTPCAVTKALQAYDIFGQISPLRISRVARHGRRTDYDLRLQKLVEEVDASTNDCKEPWGAESEVDRTNRLEANDWEFSRKVVNTEKCSLIRHYNGSSFAKPHAGSFDGCKAECDLEPSCNAFNMDLRFTITIKQAQCDLLNCPPGVSKSEEFGHVSFSRVSTPTSDVDPSPGTVDIVDGSTASGPVVIDTNNCEECGNDIECCKESIDECAIQKPSGMCVERDDCSAGRPIGNFQVFMCGPRCCKMKPGCKYSKIQRECISN